MRDVKTYIGWLMGILLMMLTACASDEGSSFGPAVLKIYVFAPDRPIVTRADNGNVDAADAEKAIDILQVWVFEHSNGNKVGHISTTSEKLSSGQAILTMEVGDDFASRKPNVDVFVAANVSSANCGLTLGEGTTREQLEAALIDSEYFGLSSPVTAVPSGGLGGLPMSGVLKNQTIFGDAPVFGVGSTTASTLSNVKLVRAVSKVRFVFCSEFSESPKHTVKQIAINGSMIPTQEYLFLDGAYSDGGGSGTRYKVGTAYNESVAPLFNPDTPKEIINCREGSTPADYIWNKNPEAPLTGQEYEALIVKGIADEDLNDLGTYYLRESDKNVTGTITYDTNKTVTFKLVTPDANFVPGDFGRNHTWIVYAYFSSDRLNVITVKVKEWQTLTPTTHEVYNW
jgi:hypothetical protein